MAVYIGLDIGGTKMNGILYDGKTVMRDLTLPTPKNLIEFKKTVLRILELLEAGKVVSGVGVGIAGVMSPKTGQILYSPNMNFLVGFNMEKFLVSNGYKNNKVENDGNCFSLAEAMLGKGKQFKNFVGITLGTGVGGGIIFDKKIYMGARASAGEAGHMMADLRYDTEYYFQKARDKKDYKKMGEVVGLLFANIINLLDVDGIVLGGTVGVKYATKFLPTALKVSQEHLIIKNSPPKVLISNLKNAGSLGAALLIQSA